MDWARHCYTAKMIVYQGQPPIDVTWFRAEPGAKWYPGPHVFGSAATWRRGEPKASIGEVEEVAYSRGPNNWGLLGLAPCGPRDAFRRGGIVGVDPPLELLPDGVAKCCKTARVASGGVRVGGSATVKVIVQQKGKGGVKVGGEAPQGDKRRQNGKGGVRAGGVALQLVIVQQLAGGGLIAGGEADQVVIVQQLAGGGLIAGGAAAQGQSHDQVGTGGIVAGGEADQHWFYSGVIAYGDAGVGPQLVAGGTASVTSGPDGSGAASLLASIVGAGTGDVSSGPDGAGSAQVVAQIAASGTGSVSAGGVSGAGSAVLNPTIAGNGTGNP